jgi:hypothetical protein
MPDISRFERIARWAMADRRPSAMKRGTRSRLRTLMADLEYLSRDEPVREMAEMSSSTRQSAFFNDPPFSRVIMLPSDRRDLLALEHFGNLVAIGGCNENLITPVDVNVWA